jgi:demethylmenaquinone methyltransferase/2-methoxy-6-polyprenyl-1,4-benzoquinol methylase
MQSRGLGEKWSEVTEVLAKVLPVYDKVNRIISMGTDIKTRKLGLEQTVNSGDVVLDAGSGPGTMSKLMKEMKNCGVVLLDPLPIMLEAAKERVGSSEPMVLGVFENLPFRDSSFDVVTTGFAIRDAKRLEEALMEIRRVLKDAQGRFLIVDLGKPDNVFTRWFIGIYWRYVVWFIGLLVAGRRGTLFSTLYTTYRKLPTNRELREMMSGIFATVTFTSKMMGGVIIVRSEK